MKVIKRGDPAKFPPIKVYRVTCQQCEAVLEWGVSDMIPRAQGGEIGHFVRCPECRMPVVLDREKIKSGAYTVEIGRDESTGE